MYYYNQDIKNILEQRRSENEVRRDQRILFYHRQYPELEKMDQAIKVAKSQILVNLIDNNESNTVLEELKRLGDRKQAYIKEKRIPAKYDEIWPACHLCKDTGVVGKIPCECYKKLLFPILLEQSGLNRYPKISFAECSSVYMEKWPERSKVYASGMAYASYFSSRSRGLIFSGPPGTGKTFLAISMAKKIIEKNYTVYVGRISEILEIINMYRIQSLAFSPDPIKFNELTKKRNLIFQSELLVIDELGVEAKGPNTVSDLLEIFGNRQQHNLPTIITTNLTIKDLAKVYDNRITSRLMGDFDVFSFAGDDIRLQDHYRRKNGK